MAYTIQGGDTLSAIAAQNKTTVAELQKLNPNITDINKIYAGQTLNLPGSTPSIGQIGTWMLPGGSDGYSGPYKAGYVASNIAPAEPLTSSSLNAGSNQMINPNAGPALNLNTGGSQADISGIMAQFQQIQAGLLDAQQKANQLAEEEKKAAETKDTETKQSVWQKMLDTISNRQTATTNQKSSEQIAADAESAALTKWGLTPDSFKEITGLVGQLTAYNTQLADLGIRKQAALDAVEQKAIDARYISQEQAVVAKRYNAEIAAVSAQAGVITQTIQMKQGLIGEAEKSADKVIGFMLQDQKQKLADLDWALDTYSDLYSIMDTDEKNAWTQARTDTQDKLNAEQDRLEFIKDLMFKNPNANITYNMTKEQALNAFDSAGGAGTVIGAVTTLDDLAKLGIIRRGAADGGWDFFYNGTPVRAEEIVQSTGIPLATLLAGSGNPSDILKIEEMKNPTLPIKDAFQKAKDQGWDRKMIEEQWKVDNSATEITPTVKAALDELFPVVKTPGLVDRIKGWWSGLWD